MATVEQLDALDETPAKAGGMVAVLDSLDEPPGLFRRIGQALMAKSPTAAAPADFQAVEGPIYAPTPRIPPAPMTPVPSQASVLATRPGEAIPERSAFAAPGVALPSPPSLTERLLEGPPIPSVAAAEEVPKPTPGQVARTLRQAGSVFAAPRGVLPSRPPLESYGMGIARSIEGLLAQAAAPQTFPPIQEPPDYDPTLLDQAFEVVGNLFTPLAILTFAAGSAPSAAAAQTLARKVAERFGVGAAKEALERLAASTVGGAGSFAFYNAVEEGLKQTGEVRRGEREAFEPSKVGEAAARGAKLGAAMGVAGGALTIPVLRKAAEVGVLATVPAVLEGRVPTMDDVIDAGVLVGTLTVASRLTGSAKQALAVPKLQRTPEQQTQVEAIPEPVKQEIVREVALMAQGEAGLARRGLEPLPERQPPPEIPPVEPGEATQRLEAAREQGKIAEPRPSPILGPSGEPLPVEGRLPTQVERAAERAGVEVQPRRVEVPSEAERFRPEEFARRTKIEAEPATPEISRAVVEIQPPGGQIAAPPAAPSTFREYVQSQGKKWPIFVTDPDYLRLRDEYEDLVRPHYEQRGSQVVDRRSGEVIVQAASGAQAQMEVNRLNAKREVPPPPVTEAAPATQIAKPPEPAIARPAPATFRGWQERPGGESFALYNLTEDIPGHPKGSTVSAETLRAAGFEPPEPSPLERPAEEAAPEITAERPAEIRPEEATRLVEAPPEREPPIIGLRRQLADLESRRERWIAERAKAIEKIRTADDPEPARQALNRIDDELAQIAKDVSGVERIIRRERARASEAAVEAPPPDVPPEFGATNRLVTREAKDAAVARLKGKLSPETLRAGVDPTVIGDLVQVGTFYFEGGAREFGAWSARMAQEFGEAIQERLQEVWDRVSRKDYSPPFFSGLQKAMEERQPKLAPATQVENIAKSAPGVSADEVKWTGLEDWLAARRGQAVTKQHVLDFLRQNEVLVEEVTKGERAVVTPEQAIEEIRATRNIYYRDRQGYEAGPLGENDVVSGGRYRREVDRGVANFIRGGYATKFERFTLPGGREYRELLLTLPPLPSERRPGEAPRVYKSPHFDEPNVLAHVRFNDRTDAQGAKVLFIEELQSDWHQEGRRKGYRGVVSPPEGYTVEPEIVTVVRPPSGGRPREGREETRWRIRTPNGNLRADLYRTENEAKAAMQGLFELGRVPQAPFAKTWHELVLKRMLRYAAEKGYDKISWTTGTQQAERYDLSKYIKRLAYQQTPEGYSLSGELQDGNVHNFGIVPRERLPETVGKDVADKIIAGEGRTPAGLAPQQFGGQKILEGLDLKVGGEGMRAFYDQIVPNFLRQYGKKWGARVGEAAIEIPFTGELRGREGETAIEALKRSREEQNFLTVPAIDITPEMRASVLREGQPMFGAANVLFTRERKEAAEARLREKAGRLSAGLDPTMLKDLAEVGGFYLEGGLREFAAWSDRMVREFGEAVRPHLQAVWHDLQRRMPSGQRPPGLVDEFGRPIRPEEPRAERTETAGRPPPPSAGPEIREAPPEGPPPLTEPVLQLGRHKEVVAAAGEMFQRAGVQRDEARWPILSDQILESLRDGSLDLPTMREILQAHRMTIAEFGEQMFRPAVRNAAQRLQMLSVLQRRLNKMAAEAGPGSEAEALRSLAQRVEDLRREAEEPELRELSWWRRADNIRRGLLVTQLGTAVRNLETQLGRLPLDALDQATQRVFGGRSADPWSAWESFTESLAQLKPTKAGLEARRASKAKIEALLQAFPREWDRLFGSYSSDIARQARERTPTTKADAMFVGAEKVVNLLNFFNRFQEFVVRRSVFWSDLSARLNRRGIDVEALSRGQRQLTEAEWDTLAPDVKASVQKALEMTWAQNPPYGSIGWHFTRLVNRLPIILSGPLPFPRFMVNSMKFLYDFSPAPFLTGKVFTVQERAKFATGDRRTISRAVIGTAALLAAWQIREQQPDDNRWYEVDAPGLGTVDIRPFNPFAAYFFVGELGKRARKGTLYKIESADIIRGIASANVRGGLGLFALDKMVAGLGELSKTGKLADALKSAGGELLSGLLVPLRTLTDAYAQFDPDFAIVRERRAEPLLGPAKAQFGIGEPVHLPTRAAPLRREQPGIRQITGLIVGSPKNALEKEIDRLQFQRTEVLPWTGNPEADNLVAKHMGPLAEARLVPFVESERYRKMTDAEKMAALAKRLRPIRMLARAKAKREDRDLFREVKEERLPGRKKLLLEERAQRRHQAISEQGTRETEEAVAE